MAKLSRIIVVSTLYNYKYSYYDFLGTLLCSQYKRGASVDSYNVVRELLRQETTNWDQAFPSVSDQMCLDSIKLIKGAGCCA